MSISFMTGVECTPGDLAELSEIEIVVDRRLWYGGVDVWLRGKNWHLAQGGGLYLATGFVLSEFNKNGEMRGPSFSLRQETVQRLMDDLWRAGFRPSEEHLPTADTAKALGNHLEDMRKIAFMYLDSEKKRTCEDKYFREGNE